MGKRWVLFYLVTCQQEDENIPYSQHKFGDKSHKNEKPKQTYEFPVLQLDRSRSNVLPFLLTCVELLRSCLSSFSEDRRACIISSIYRFKMTQASILKPHKKQQTHLQLLKSQSNLSQWPRKPRRRRRYEHLRVDIRSHQMEGFLE
jgi:hypothetical protein